MSDEVDEKELDKILESALEDFEEDEKKEIQQSASKASQSEEKKSQQPKSEEKSNATSPAQTTEGISDELVGQLTKLMESLAEGNEDATMEELLRNFNANLPQNLPNLDLPELEQISDEGLKDLLKDLEKTNSSELESAMMEMMKKLVSPEILYEPIKEMKKQYPGWLQKNKNTISSTEYARYQKQYECVCKICEVYDKNQDATLLFPLIQQMQETGQPPADIVKSFAPDLQLDANGNPLIPGMDESCSIM